MVNFTHDHTSLEIIVLVPFWRSHLLLSFGLMCFLAR